MEAFARRLVASDDAVREKAFKSVRIFLNERHGSLLHKDYMRVWKALFYAMWMADKAIYQRSLAQRLGDIAIDLYRANKAAAMQYVRAFWETIIREWHGIDRLRLDKYYNLVRRFSQVGFELFSLELTEEVARKQPAAKGAFDKDGNALPSASGDAGEGAGVWEGSAFTAAYNEMLSELPLHATRRDIPNGLRLHLLDSCVEMIASVPFERCPGLLPVLIKPHIALAATTVTDTVIAMAAKMFTKMATLPAETFDVVPSLGEHLFAIGGKSTIRSANRKVLYAASVELSSRSKGSAPPAGKEDGDDDEEDVGSDNDLVDEEDGAEESDDE